MIQITDRSKCCGCSACFSACKSNAIEMRHDEEGFLYPHINIEKCVDCKLCNNVCPIIHKKTPECDEPRKAYVIRNKDVDTLNSSASGGFFSAVAEYVIAEKGYVFGAIYDENFRVKHIGTNSLDEIMKFRSSKYVQSDLNGVLKEVKKILDKGIFVCFSGTPCQVEGLLKYLGRDYNNLITVDIICHGVPSPMLWEQYLSYQVNRNKSPIKEINFRNKDYGYHNNTLKLIFENGKVHHGSMRNDAMMRCFFGEISSRPSCYSCAFKYAKHESDFTIFDAWHGAQLIGKDEDDKGYTHLFVQSKKGEDLLSSLKEKMEITEINYEEAINLDGPMVRKSAIPHPNRQIFLKEVSQLGIEKAIKNNIPFSKKDLLVVSSKGFLYRIGMLEKMKKIAHKIHI